MIGLLGAILGFENLILNQDLSDLRIVGLIILIWGSGDFENKMAIGTTKLELILKLKKSYKS